MLSLLGLILVVAVLLFVMLIIATVASRCLDFNKEDEITIVFCGSKKSLASGVPMAKVLFAGYIFSMVVLLMLFYQRQLMVCAVLAKRYVYRSIDIAPAWLRPVWTDVSP